MTLDRPKSKSVTVCHKMQWCCRSRAMPMQYSRNIFFYFHDFRFLDKSSQTSGKSIILA